MSVCRRRSLLRQPIYRVFLARACLAVRPSPAVPAFGHSAPGEGVVRVPARTEGNRELVVETLRSLAELVIWGDQHDARFFDFFAEKHLLSHFNRILRQPANQRGEVPQQVAPLPRLLSALSTPPQADRRACNGTRA